MKKTSILLAIIIAVLLFWNLTMQFKIAYYQQTLENNKSLFNEKRYKQIEEINAKWSPFQMDGPSNTGSIGFDSRSNNTSGSTNVIIGNVHIGEFAKQPALKAESFSIMNPMTGKYEKVRSLPIW